ncbi:MAG TPA: TIGR03560 family F420-dependent LLM class oxidoreductase [Gaiellaceae bacterium]|nr:TIGR03560 family F420-dependent LLM class oxidoreductase [Gaiellaceae bacterium]
MELGLVIVTQSNVTWSDWCNVADACERSGIRTLYAADHYLSEHDELGDVSHDAWTVIAGLAVRTSSLRLGTLVTPVTFRPPAVLANVVATADHISGGRVELGLGAGWMEREHEAFGFPFPELRVRRQMLAEQLEIVHRLWTEERVTFRGDHYQLENAPGRPRPAQSPHPPIIVGGSGTRGSAIPAARFADEYNAAWVNHPYEFPVIRDRVLAACEEVGRDPATMRISVPLYCVVGQSRDEAMDRARAIYDLRPRDQTFDDWFGDYTKNRLVGSVDEIEAGLVPYAEAGADQAMIMHVPHTDIDAIQLIGERLAPLLAR